MRESLLRRRRRPRRRSQEEISEFEEFARTPAVHAKIFGYIAPNIFGSEDIKKAVASLLFGGARKVGGWGWVGGRRPLASPPPCLSSLSLSPFLSLSHVLAPSCSFFALCFASVSVSGARFACAAGRRRLPRAAVIDM